MHFQQKGYHHDGILEWSSTIIVPQSAAAPTPRKVDVNAAERPQGASAIPQSRSAQFLFHGRILNLCAFVYWLLPSLS